MKFIYGIGRFHSCLCLCPLKNIRLLEKKAIFFTPIRHLLDFLQKTILIFFLLYIF